MGGERLDKAARGVSLLSLVGMGLIFVAGVFIFTGYLGQSPGTLCPEVARLQTERGACDERWRELGACRSAPDGRTCGAEEAEWAGCHKRMPALDAALAAARARCGAPG